MITLRKLFSYTILRNSNSYFSDTKWMLIKTIKCDWLPMGTSELILHGKPGSRFHNMIIGNRSPVLNISPVYSCTSNPTICKYPLEAMYSSTSVNVLSVRTSFLFLSQMNKYSFFLPRWHLHLHFCNHQFQLPVRQQFSDCIVWSLLAGVVQRRQSPDATTPLHPEQFCLMLSN